MGFARVGVVGAGNIGVGVVTDLVLHGIPSVVVDVSEAVLSQARDAVLTNVRFAGLVSKALPRVAPDEAERRMTLTKNIDDIASCDFIVENVTEDWQIKRPLYETLDRIVPAGVPIGANTSCLSITQIGSVTRRPDKVIGVHFMNPVHLKPTVEVIRGAHTSQQTLEALLQLCDALGKDAIVVEDLPGFVSNRISHLFMNEAAFVLQDGVASADQIDRIFRKCFGHAMGPLETADLIGLDTVMRSLDVLYDSYHDPKFRCCPLLKKLVHAGHLGVKTGKGFHVYPHADASRATSVAGPTTQDR